MQKSRAQKTKQKNASVMMTVILPDASKTECVVALSAKDALHAPKGVNLMLCGFDGMRHVIESRSVFGVLDLEYVQQHDYLHHRGSGMDTVLAAICKKKNILVFVNKQKLFTLDPVHQAMILGRILQNKMLCEKYGLQMLALEYVKDTAYAKKASLFF